MTLKSMVKTYEAVHRPKLAIKKTRSRKPLLSQAEITKLRAALDEQSRTTRERDAREGIRKALRAADEERRGR